MIIKILLIGALSAAALFAMRTQARGNHLAVRRLAAGIFVLAGALSVLFPQLTTRAANLVGVGRGTDLLLYATVVAFLFTTVGLYQRIHSLERRLTDLAREVTLRTADQRTDKSIDR